MPLVAEGDPILLNLPVHIFPVRGANPGPFILHLLVQPPRIGRERLPFRVQQVAECDVVDALALEGESEVQCAIAELQVTDADLGLPKARARTGRDGALTVGFRLFGHGTTGWGPHQLGGSSLARGPHAVDPLPPWWAEPIDGMGPWQLLWQWDEGVAPLRKTAQRTTAPGPRGPGMPGLRDQHAACLEVRLPQMVQNRRGLLFRPHLTLLLGGLIGVIILRLIPILRIRFTPPLVEQIELCWVPVCAEPRPQVLLVWGCVRPQE
mmetsp:Transcript_63380/g.113060  ORF Transcript_63380/g.113060 Transcript_63380/m.113060 type:complete len:265 (-) Transcript_63380:1263-2057(-)